MIVCVFDTETTGLIDNHMKRLDRQPEVIEFACVWADWDDLDKIEARYEVLIKPSLGPLPDKTKEATGLIDEDLKDCVTFDQVSDKILSLLTGAQIVCGHNLSYDMEMMDIEYERLRTKIAWPSARMCTVEQTAHVAQEAQRKPSKHNRVNLGDLHYYLTGEEHKDAHRAMADVMATLRCLREIRRRGWL
jgi:DNA polymerase III epsilon subunit-like protein